MADKGEKNTFTIMVGAMNKVQKISDAYALDNDEIKKNEEKQFAQGD